MNSPHDHFLIGLLTANISIEGIAKAVQQLLPFLNAAVVLLQTGIGIFTLLYVYRKWINYRKQTEKK